MIIMSAKPRNVKDKVRSTRRNTRGLMPMTASMEDMGRVRSRKAAPPLEAITDAQHRYINSIRTNKLTFGIGPAGTGKSYIATMLAADALMAGDVEKIIITRPIVEAGENIGFLPGEMNEKTLPYFKPIKDILEKRLGVSQVEMFIKNGKIEFAPLAFMRGSTLGDAFIILDEAQNTTPAQMKLFLTRLGENSKIIIDGDLTQKDISGLSGLSDALRRIRGVKDVNTVTFTEDDIVRSGLVKDILAAYRNPVEEEDIAGIEDIVAGWK